MNDIDPLHPTLQFQRNLHEIYAVFMVKLSVMELILLLLLTTIVVFIGDLSCIWLGVPLDDLLGACSFIFNVRYLLMSDRKSPIVPMKSVP